MTVGEHYAAQHQARMGKARSGMSRAIDGGRAFELLTALAGYGRSMWPTPTAAQSREGGVRALDGGAGARALLEKNLGSREAANEMQRLLNPTWVEWLMGFPMDWTNLTQKGN